jgi:hypothetical protein
MSTNADVFREAHPPRRVPPRGRGRPRYPRALASALLLAAASALSPAARADDVVFLKSGGRLKGQVKSEDPRTGVKIRLADGRERVVSAAEVERVEYEDQAPAAPPAAPPPSAVPAARAGEVAIEVAEPAEVFIDGELAGKAPVHRGGMPLGRHKVKVAFEGGGATTQTVWLEAGKVITVSLSPDATELAFRPRRGMSVGASLDAIAVLAPETPTPYGGVRGTVFLNVGASPVADLRIGAFASGAGGAYRAALAPLGLSFTTAFHAARVVILLGAQGGYAPATEVRTYDDSLGGIQKRMTDGGFVGGHLGFGVALGEDRRWELGLRQDVSLGFGARFPVFFPITSLGVTGVFFPSAARAGSGAEAER